MLSNTFFGREFAWYQHKACQNSAGQILVLEYVRTKRSAVKWWGLYHFQFSKETNLPNGLEKVILNITNNLLKMKCLFCGIL